MTWQLSFNSLNSFQAITHFHSNLTETSGISCIIYPQEKNPSLSLSHFIFKILILYL